MAATKTWDKAYYSYVYRAVRSPLKKRVMTKAEFIASRLQGPQDVLGRHIHEWSRKGTKPAGFMYKTERGGKLLESRMNMAYNQGIKAQAPGKISNSIDKIKRYIGHAARYNHKNLIRIGNKMIVDLNRNLRAEAKKR